MTDRDRRYRCPTCDGIVSLPTGSRRYDLATIREQHERTCPGTARALRQNATTRH